MAVDTQDSETFPNAPSTAVVVGAGLAGCLAAQVLSRRGYSVHVYEKRPHVLEHGVIDAGRTINLSVSPRGLRALTEPELRERFLAAAVAIDSRAFHLSDGRLLTIKYGEPDWCNYSIGRNELNQMLMRSALLSQEIEFRFDTKCIRVDFQEQRAHFYSEADGRLQVSYDLLVGADGAYSTVREQMAFRGLTNVDRRELGSLYQEFLIPVPPAAGHLGSTSIHVWPRGEFFMVALPNVDGSLRATLVFPADGTAGFLALTDSRHVERFFARNFPDVVTNVVSIEQRRPRQASTISVISCDTLTYRDSVLLLGDAAHTLAPFLGQGINLGFDDCAVLGALLAKYSNDRGMALAEYEKGRKAEGDAAATLSLSNYAELSGGTEGAPDSRSRATSVVHRLVPRASAEPPLAVSVNFLGLQYQEVLDRYRDAPPCQGTACQEHSVGEERA